NPDGSLASIADDVGNQQVLNWSGTDPFLTVRDITSGRQLVFHKGSGGYLSYVDVPNANGNGYYNRTLISFDTNGHMQGVNTYAGDGTTLLRSTSYTYGDAQTPDAITAVQQGLSVTSNGYLPDPNAHDPFGMAIPRVTSSTFGSPQDTTSSDGSGDGKVQGTI